MKLPKRVLDEFRRHGREGGHARAAALTAAERTAGARRAASARWIAERFGAKSFQALGLPGGATVDNGLADLTSGVTSVESLLVSLAASRLRREGVPVAPPLPDPDQRLYELLARSEGDMAHARYNALRREVVSFADACHRARRDRRRA